MRNNNLFMSDLLGKNWLTSQPIDYEYKQYMFMAYKHAHLRKIDGHELYPGLKDIIAHKEYVDDFMFRINAIEDSKTNTLGIDWLEMKLVYKSLINDDCLDEIKKIAKYGKVILDELYVKYSNLYEKIEKIIDIEGQMISMFTMLNGFISFTHNMKITYYEYNISKHYSPHPNYVLELAEISEKMFYKDRYMKNFFNVSAISDYPFETAIKPVFKRKFLSQVVNNS